MTGIILVRQSNMKTLNLIPLIFLVACSAQTTVGVDEPRVACRALTPECMAMAEGISTEAWIDKTCNDSTNPDAWMCPVN